MKKLAALILLMPLLAFANPKDKAYCEGLDPSVDRKACMLEQRNARAADKEGKLATDQAVLEKNRIARCQVFREDADRLSCYDRVTKGAVSGSVQSGGTVTTHKEVIVGK